jgi:hypothetical protein
MMQKRLMLVQLNFGNASALLLTTTMVKVLVQLCLVLWCYMVLQERDSDGGYVQATYVIPTGTKLGVAYGVSKLDEASGESNCHY